MPEGFVEIALGLAHIQAFYSNCQGGASASPFASLNFSDNVGDAFVHIEENRRRLFNYLNQEASIRWLHQVHGNQAVLFDSVLNKDTKADAIIATQKNQLCLVQTADCLPILIASCDQTKVAAIHAGWRGLLNGVIENTLTQFDRPFIAWLGPVICQQCFEVGEEVMRMFTQKNIQWAKAFKAKSDTRYLMDLKAIAKSIIQQCDCINIIDAKLCTYENPDQFFSYRRDGKTGRQISAIMITDK
ncbi:peptidoglycan editing factor PgeF [Facilibium subflavum]|uniref:peptidoglycan editing factor PgeF n=1 Tax=Facilibium subflavum TaxID=2219058 RepID=UPI000E64B774|nr:peptidoglycan editing factor PgeF [Facilibium subflavum]